MTLKKLFPNSPENKDVKRCKTCNEIIKNRSGEYCSSNCSKEAEKGY